MADAALRESGFIGRIVNKRRARYIVFPASAQDVSRAIKFATRERLTIAVKGGGNHASGASSVEDGLVIDLGNLNGISVDRNKEEVTVGGGCRWGDVYSTLQKHGLVCIGGGVHIVGVGGHLTGGGWGPLTGKYGMGCDNILYARVALADGQIVSASATENQDLFWAIKGGSSQFGVVTDFVLRTYPEPGKFFYRIMTFQSESLSVVLERFRAFLNREHRQDGWLIGFIFFTRSPDKHRLVRCRSHRPIIVVLTKLQPLIVLNFTGVGEPDQHNDVWSSFREAAIPSAKKRVGDLSIFDISHSFDDTLLKGPPRVMNAGCVVTELWPGMGEELWESFIHYTNSNSDVIHSMVALEFHATRRQSPELSCFPIHESIHHAVVIHGQHHNSESDQGAASWLNASTSIIRRHQTQNGGKDLGLAANATSLPASPQDIWGKNYDRLRCIKAKYDPNSVFNRFHSIEPLISSAKVQFQAERGGNNL
ncbi:hypothetical protein N8I77_003446 [Diaporthe amygdali]|uniref:FAD-binding PCMH-type domain-containing protein n=1 Tax=Phomopsis amygdali TaxID=1214568 RepID=A0AAD9W4Z7_PHOAM|nr:hypothetical protein N8I77_003446 [Diaporthe amygdali]